MDGAIKFHSVCSGIEAASVAWNPRGWRVAVAEIDSLAVTSCIIVIRPAGQCSCPIRARPRTRRNSGREAAIRAIAPLPADGAIPNFGDLEQFRKWPDAAAIFSLEDRPARWAMRASKLEESGDTDEGREETATASGNALPASAVSPERCRWPARDRARGGL